MFLRFLRAILLGAAFTVSLSAFAETITVNTLADTSADGNATSIANLIATPGSDGLISLREAISATLNEPGADDIKFSVSGTIFPSGAFGNFPSLTTGGTTIDGGGQITLDGQLLVSGGFGLILNSADNVVRGLKFIRFNQHGVRITGAFATGNLVEGCTIGEPGFGNGRGVVIQAEASGNTIGGSTATSRNVISSNNFSGIEITQDCNANEVIGNYIGVNAAGTAAQGNLGHGVLINAASNNTVGLGNVISGNTLDGVRISNIGSSGDPNASNNSVYGNYIGVNAAGNAAIANGGSGVGVSNASGTNVGGIIAGRRNIISGNTSGGVTISGAEATECFVRGNYIGTDAAGTAAIGNGGAGVFISDGVVGCVIGGASATARNVICGSASAAVRVDDGKDTIIRGNYLGVNVTGDAALANGRGVLLQEGTTGTVVGGTNAGAGNVISGNTFTGVYIGGTGADNSVVGNFIGVNAAGDAAIPNGAQGVIVVSGVTNTSIGGPGTGRNIISGNTGAGIALDVSAAGVSVLNNYIGLDATGTEDLGNGFFGIDIVSANSNILIGGVPGEGNVISGNAANGVNVSALNGGTFYGNYIGTNAAGTAAIPNDGLGLSFEDNCTNIQIGDGTADQRNVISGNANSGIHFYSGGSGFTNILGNYIGTNAAGDAAIGNGEYGVDVGNANNVVNIGGVDTGNVVSGNVQGGLNVTGVNVAVKSNIIGLNAAGTAAVPNGEFGVAANRAGGGLVVGGNADGEENVISGNNGPGVFLFGLGGSGGVRLRKNSIFANTGAGIERSISADPGPPEPVFEVYAGNILLTNASAVTFVEIYVDDEDEGETFVTGILGTGSPITVSNSLLEPYVGRNMTATATTLSLGTSLFSAPITLGAPVISEQPIGRQVVEGRAFSLSVDVESALPLSIQWKFDDGTGFVDLLDGQGGVTGANSTTLNVASATLGSDGVYVCAVGNAADTVNSEEADVTVVSESNGDLVVNTLSDAADAPDFTSVADLIAEPGADGRISLREAIAAANSHVGPSSITFSVSGSISLMEDLPALGDDIIGNGDGEISIFGSGISLLSGAAGNALWITSPGNNIVGLVIGNFAGVPITITGAEATGNHIRACKIGTDGVNDLFNSSTAIEISGGASNNSIGVLLPNNKGGVSLGYRNVIANNGGPAIYIAGAGTDNNIVAGNYLGVLDDGITTGYNGVGVGIFNGASNNIVGGSQLDGTGNVIAGGSSGIQVTSNGTEGNIVRGNVIGLAADGATSTFMGTGVAIDGNASGTLLGGAEPGEGNIIAGTTNFGVELGSEATGTVIAGNTIGLAADGLSPKPCDIGIYAEGTGTGNEIGLPGAGNVISGNTQQGILISSVVTTSNRIRGNVIGLGADGATAVPNGGDGIVLGASDDILVGGPAAGEANVIAGNGGSGVLISDTTDSNVEGNLIGVNAAGPGPPEWRVRHIPAGNELWQHHRRHHRRTGQRDCRQR